MRVKTHLGLAVLGRHVADAHALRGVTPQELHCGGGGNSSRTDNADQSNSNKHVRLTNVNSHQSGAEDLAGSRGGGGGDEGRPRRGAKVATRARRAARPVSCKALIAAPRGCG